MKRAFVISLVVLLGVAGCGNTAGDPEAELAKHLKDPYSMRVEERIVYQDFACLKYNAKNGYGAYTGTTWAVLQRYGNGWMMFKDNYPYCSESTLKDFADPKLVAARKAVLVTVLAAMRKNKLVADDADTLDKVAGPCYITAIEIESLGKRAIDGDTEEERQHYRQRFDERLQALDGGKCESAV